MVDRNLLHVIALLSWLPLVAHSDVVLLAGDDDDPNICHVDPFNGIEWNCGWYQSDWSNTDFVVTSTKGMAIHPVTRQVYVVLETDEDFHRLIRFDPRSYSAYDVGNLGQLITGLAFDNIGTLYGVSSDSVNGGATTDSIFTIDLQTAEVTKIADLPAPDGFDDTIAYNIDEGKLYHWGGFNTQSFNRLNLQTLQWENVGVPAGWPAGVGIKAFTYDSVNLRFIGFRQTEFSGGEEFFTISYPGNVQAALATPPANAHYRGLAFVDDSLGNMEPPRLDSGRSLFGVEPNLNLVEGVIPETGETSGTLGVLLNGTDDFDGFNGMATDPTNGDVYVALRANRNKRSERQLAVMSPDNLGAFSVGASVDGLAGLAFSEDGQLYGITGDGGANPSSLYAIDKSNATASLLLALADNGSGEAIAYNSRNGKLYRFSGKNEFQVIDLSSPTITPIPLTGDVALAADFVPASAVYDDIENKFYVHAYNSTDVGLHTYYSVTPAGATTAVLVDAPNRKGMAFSLAEEMPLAGAARAQDVNSNGNSDIGVLLAGEFGSRNWVYIMDGSNGSQLKKLGFGPEKAKAYASIPDMSGDGIREHAVLVEGSLFARVKNPVDGSLLGRLSFDRRYAPVAMLAVGDIDGDSSEDLAVIGHQLSTGAVQAQVKRISAGTLISRFNFDKNFAPIDAVFLDNVGGSQSAGPEIAVLGVNLEGQVRAQIKDAATGLLERVIWFDKTYDPLAVTALPDPNGNQTYLGVLGRNDDGVVRAQIKDARTGNLVSLVRFNSAYKPIAFLGFTDSDSDGSGEVTVVGSDDLGRVVAQTKEIETTALVSIVKFSSAYQVVDVLGTNNVAGTGRNEIAVLGRDYYVGEYRLQTKDLLTGAPVSTIAVP